MFAILSQTFAKAPEVEPQDDSLNKGEEPQNGKLATDDTQASHQVARPQSILVRVRFGREKEAKCVTQTFNANDTLRVVLEAANAQVSICFSMPILPFSPLASTQEATVLANALHHGR
jgi:hypothetical protein